MAGIISLFRANPAPPKSANWIGSPPNWRSQIRRKMTQAGTHVRRPTHTESLTSALMSRYGVSYLKCNLNLNLNLHLNLASSEFSDPPRPDLSFVALFVFGAEGRTDIMCKTNDHLFDRSLVGQLNILAYCTLWMCIKCKLSIILLKIWNAF